MVGGGWWVGDCVDHISREAFDEGVSGSKLSGSGTGTASWARWVVWATVKAPRVAARAANGLSPTT